MSIAKYSTQPPKQAGDQEQVWEDLDGINDFYDPRFDSDFPEEEGTFTNSSLFGLIHPLRPIGSLKTSLMLTLAFGIAICVSITCADLCSRCLLELVHTGWGSNISDEEYARLLGLVKGASEQRFPPGAYAGTDRMAATASEAVANIVATPSKTQKIKATSLEGTGAAERLRIGTLQLPEALLERIRTVLKGSSLMSFAI
jgi:hypothetical protein